MIAVLAFVYRISSSHSVSWLSALSKNTKYAVFGILRPRIQLRTSLRDTPALFASCSIVMSFRFMSCRSHLLKCVCSIVDPLLVHLPTLQKRYFVAQTVQSVIICLVWSVALLGLCPPVQSELFDQCFTVVMDYEMRVAFCIQCEPLFYPVDRFNDSKMFGRWLVLDPTFSHKCHAAVAWFRIAYSPAIILIVSSLYIVEISTIFKACFLSFVVFPVYVQYILALVMCKE